MSVSRADDLLLNQVSKMAKIENVQLHQLLVLCSKSTRYATVP